MIGDKLVITDYHRRNGKLVGEAVLPRLSENDRLFVITVAGESGSGKSETAATTAALLESREHQVLILGQDDYFKLPPKSNAARRVEDIGWVGTNEVELNLIDQELREARGGAASITKPLVDFADDSIGDETVELAGVRVIIVEGTYTTLIEEADFRVFIDRTYRDTLEHRKARARDQAEGEFIERVLEIEHRIISAHKTRADLVLPRA